MKSRIYSFRILVLISFMWSFYTLPITAETFKLHITKLYPCDHSNTTFIIKQANITEYDKQSYVDIVADLLQDVSAQNMTVEIERCEKSGANCEVYSRFNFKEFCTLFKIKNTFWSSMIDGIKPQPECPNVKKGTYELHNGTMHVDHMIKLFPDTPKYFWKLHGKAFKTDGGIFACGSAEGYIE